MPDLQAMKDVMENLVAEAFPFEGDPGCSVLVVRGEETLTFQRGMADLEKGMRVGPETNFRLASVAKQFTAACILMLEERGGLGLEQTMAELFPGFPAYGAGITVEHLLRHTSGLKDYEPLVEGMVFAEPVMDREVVEILAGQTETDFAPGSRFRYSNSGYAVLAQIVERISGLSFPAFLKVHVFDPLGMGESMALVNRRGAPEVRNRATGYRLDGDRRYIWSDQGATSAVLGDGGIYTSVVGYEKWIRAYGEGRVLKRETVGRAWEPGMTTGGEMVAYGYGWRLEPMGGGWRPYHPGSTSGFRNGVVVNRERGVVVLVLTNRSNGDSVALAKAIEGVAVGA